MPEHLTTQVDELNRRRVIEDRISYLITWSERHTKLNNSTYVFFNVLRDCETGCQSVYLVIFDRVTNQEITLNNNAVDDLAKFISISSWF